MTLTPTPPRRSDDDVDLLQVLAVLRRAWLPLIAAPVLLGGATYVLSSRQAPVFEATTSLMSAMPDNANDVLRGSSVTASQLPQGAVDEVVHSRASVDRIISTIAATDLSSDVKSAISDDLNDELATDAYARLTVKARLDQQQRGVYDVKASAETPMAAKLLADAAASALLQWDTERARAGVTRARQNLQAQLDNLNSRLAALPEGSLEAQSLVAARGQLLLNLSQATVFEEGASGNLTLLAQANAPRNPVSPKPRRNAALVFLLTLFAGAGAALLTDALRRRVRNAGDVLQLGVSTLGELPRVARIKRGQVVGLARTGEFYEPSGFIRVNLASAVPQKGAVIAVTSPRPAEGKSTLVATLATSYSAAGKKVLVIDMDLHRPSQQEYWNVSGRPWVALPGNSVPLRCDVTQAIEHPTQASALDVGGDIHYLPAGETGRRAAALLSRPDLPELLHTWAANYDLVLLDTPPVLALADAYVIGQKMDGMILVVESGETSVPELQRVLTTIGSTGANLAGVVINKVPRTGAGYYYNYNYNTVLKP
ncbi:polysaccharide biosynthesis tyrosine autokinase [Deinococcus knuensis]|uniref:ExoP n=1 Tax=Deinococcus knuensis TaxID=1837380 RepID=A0ABQ2SEQ1_9DEIO|nr:polysaccharide biosynthesis tyrosine autokinase [Deinococcus knuensis]GGS26153.1 exoP [Deinococcus knuensis]